MASYNPNVLDIPELNAVRNVHISRCPSLLTSDDALSTASTGSLLTFPTFPFPISWQAQESVVKVSKLVVVVHTASRHDSTAIRRVARTHRQRKRYQVVGTSDALLKALLQRCSKHKDFVVSQYCFPSICSFDYQKPRSSVSGLSYLLDNF